RGRWQDHPRARAHEARHHGHRLRAGPRRLQDRADRGEQPPAGVAMADVEALVSEPIPRERSVFCNRTLNLRSIRAIGYDMDYRLIHYATGEWERRAYEHLRTRLAVLGWPVEGLEFDPSFAIRGLILDVEKGNVIKANRFGYVKRAFYGQNPLSYEEQ